MTRLSRSRLLQRVLAAAVVLLTGAGGTVLWLRQAPTAVTVDDALVQFREEAATPAPGEEPLPASSPSPGAPAPGQPTVAPADEPAVQPTTPTTPTTSPTTTPTSTPGAPAAGTTSPTSPGPASRWPDEGVYPFATEGGGETDALGGARHDYPEQVPLIVRRGGCGYTVRWQPLDERWDEWEFCADGTARPMARITTYHEFFQRGQRQDFDCGRVEMSPAAYEPGDTLTWTCRSGNGEVDSTTTVVGIETLDIGGTPVRAVHHRHDVVFSGANEGSQVFEWWLEMETGLPVRLVRDLEVTSQSPFGKVNYSERFTSQAVTLTPRR